MIDRFGHALTDWLVPVNAWTAVLLAGALLLDRALARRAGASLRMALYAPVALRVLLPFSWSIPGAHVPSLAVLMPLQSLSGATAGNSPSFLPWYVAAGGLYVAVALGLALRAIVRRRQLARALASARPLKDVDAPCPVLAHAELGPMVVGVLAPRIVLPQALLDGATEPELACISRHEAAHVRRRDPWLSLAIEALLVAAWPVLPLWIAAARVRHLIELACDEAALANADAAERRRYGHVLLDIAEQRPLVLAGAGSLHFGSTLRARIEAIALQRPWPRAVQATLVASAVAAFAACSSAGPATMPQATGSERPAAAGGGGLDEYGYQYEADTAAEAAKAPPGAPTAQQRNAQGRLAPEVIQGVVRQSFGSFRTCYENGLKHNPKLQGTATIGFAIAPSGSVENATDNGSTLPDADAIQCILKGFSSLKFPPPQDGYVTVVYPIEFSPGN
jgi:beta-lactamase regulating signal transducer with metallopeptidase domain